MPMVLSINTRVSRRLDSNPENKIHNWIVVLAASLGFSFVTLISLTDSLCGQQPDPDPQTVSPDNQTSKPADSARGNSTTSKKNHDTSKSARSDGVTFSDPVTVRWKVGVKVVAGASDSLDIYVAIPVPNEWPEQRVVIDGEEMPPSIGKVTYANLPSGVRRQLIKVPVLPAREEFEITTTFRVSTSQINPAPDTTIFLRPKTSHKEGKSYLAASSFIAFQDSKMRNLVKELTADKAHLWQEIEALYDWARDNIDQKDMLSTDSLKTFRKREGSEEDKVALFVALCRCHKIPARMVWVDGGCHAEFMLIDPQEQAHWFPCNPAGIREFGFLSEPRIILQKGESIKLPEKDVRQKFVAEHVSCKGLARPQVEFIRELLPAEK